MAVLDWSRCPVGEGIPGKVSGASLRHVVLRVFRNADEARDKSSTVSKCRTQEYITICKSSRHLPAVDAFLA